MTKLLQRIADYFVSQYNGHDETAPKMQLSVDELRSIIALNIEKCNLEAKIRNLQSIKTNADRIRNMSDEELTEFIAGLNNHCLAGIGECDCSNESTANCEEICNRRTFMWLQSEAE